MMLGIIQGLTEFLPVSSSAHLVLFPAYFGWSDPGLAFDVALHLGTLLAVLAYFRADWVPLVRSVFLIKDESLAKERALAFKLLLATIPGAIAGVLLEHRVESTFRSAELIAWALMILGALLAVADRLGKGTREIHAITPANAVMIGVAQSLALIPGVSRSGITITLALALGLERTAAARFSFLMSIPIIAGAGILKAKTIWHTPDKAMLGIGFTASAIAGFLAIWVLMRYVERHRYTPFVVYRWALGAFVLFNLAKF